MRNSKMAWFGPPKVTRLGIRPVGWQGVLVCLGFILLFVGAMVVFTSFRSEFISGIVLIVLFVAAAYATGGRPNNNTFN